MIWNGIIVVVVINQALSEGTIEREQWGYSLRFVLHYRLAFTRLASLFVDNLLLCLVLIRLSLAFSLIRVCGLIA